jgi:signal transduction histidine kinase
MTTTALAGGAGTRPVRVLAWALVVGGGVAAAVVGAYVVELALGEAAVAGALPLAWLVAGSLALRARPDHVGALLMAAVGTLHLAAFAVTLPLSTAPAAAGPGPWTAALLASVLYASGFAALAVLLAHYPDGTARSPWFARVAFGAAGLLPLLDALTHAELPFVFAADSTGVVAPAPLPVVALPFMTFPAVPLLVVAGAVLLVRRGRRAEGTLRRQLTWATGAGGLLALLLLATPAASALLPGDLWSGVFVAVASAIPFVLLAGLARYRLMDVDVYVGRTLAQGAVVVVVVTAYALAATSAGLGTPAAVLVVVLAVLTGGALRARLEGLVDRWLTGGRVRGQALVRHLVETLESTAPGHVAQRTVDTIASGLEVAWVRMVLDSGTVTQAGAAAGAPACVVPLAGAGETVGSLECGPRHGGWSETEVAQVRLLARHAALAVHSDELATELAGQVEELRSSRRRLVHAEQSVRRRLERDLHDGVQQQLVALLSRLGALEVLVEPASPAAQFTAMAKAQAESSLTELRELIRGIHPPVLADRGLVAAIRARAGLLPLPVGVTADDEHARYAPEVESAAYYVVSEALTNVLKHADATSASVRVDRAGESLLIRVTDDGVGPGEVTGEAAGAGSGLAGLRDRVEALGGRFAVGPHEAGGTTLSAELPVEGAR